MASFEHQKNLILKNFASWSDILKVWREWWSNSFQVLGSGLKSKGIEWAMVKNARINQESTNMKPNNAQEMAFSKKFFLWILYENFSIKNFSSNIFQRIFNSNISIKNLMTNF